MAYLHNGPDKQTIIRLEARKSFSLGILIKDFLGRPLDITDTTLRMVVRKNFATTESTDAGNLITSSEASLPLPEQGYARFDIQASELNHAPGEYQYAIVMISSGYSSVIIEGLLDISPNTEFQSMTETYAPGINSPLQLDVLLREQQAITVYAGQALAPGTLSYTQTDKSNLDQLVLEGWDALANRPVFGTAAFVNVDDIAIPAGGSPTAALLKRSDTDYDVHWAQIAVGGTGLSATSQPVGAVPTATGVDTWDWAVPVPAVLSVNGRGDVVVLTSDDIDEGTVNLYVSDAQRIILDAFSATPSYNDLADRPSLGTAAAKDVGFFLPSGTVLAKALLPKVSGLLGYTSGTGAPSGGASGDLHFQYS